MSVVPLFDYARLGAVASDFQEAAAAIRKIGARHAIEIGRLLLTLKEKAKHGTFSAWVTSELQMQMRTAQNMMSAARFVEGKSEIIACLPPTLLYKLASPSTDKTIVDDVVETAAAGQPIDAVKIGIRIAVASDAEIEGQALYRRHKPEGRAKKTAELVVQRLNEQDTYFERLQKQRAELRPIAAEIAAMLPEKMRTRLRQEKNHGVRSDFVGLLLEELELRPIENGVGE
jgi:Protein of unknown function (DUF3102)